MPKLIQSKPLFGIPFYVWKIDPKEYDKDKILNTIKENYKLDPNRNKWSKTSNLHHANKDFANKDFKQINYTKVGRLYGEIIKNFFSQLDFVKPIDYTWQIVNYTAQKKNQFMNEHDHLPDCSFSGVHFLKINKSNSPLKFTNPASIASYVRFIIPDYYVFNRDNLDHSYLNSKQEFLPEEDTVCIFPSSLKHEVPIQQSNDLRVTIAFNITIKDKNENKR